MSLFQVERETMLMGLFKDMFYERLMEDKTALARFERLAEKAPKEAERLREFREFLKDEKALAAFRERRKTRRTNG